MRLWHQDLISVLPDKQLLSQWRELNSIYKKKDKHILINFIYQYSDLDLLIYSQLVIQEMIKRNFKIKSLNNYYKYFKKESPEIVEDLQMPWKIEGDYVFKKHFDNIYLIICCYNLYEKAIRGQKGFDESKLDFLFKCIATYKFNYFQLLNKYEELVVLNLVGGK